MAVDKERLRELNRENPDNYFTGKYIFNRIGRMFTAIAVRTPLTPNQMTWIWGGMMVLSAILYSTGEWSYCVLGGVLWILAYGMDYSDGVVAKYKGMCSGRGAFLDQMNHRITYPMLMFCIGYGVFISGGSSWLDFEWFNVNWYLFLGVAAGIGMSVFLDIVPMYQRYKTGDASYRDGKGSMGVEAQLVNNKKLFRAFMNFNPLVFTNMMVLLLVFALLDQMGVFLLIFGIGYPLVSVGRILMMYRDL